VGQANLQKVRFFRKEKGTMILCSRADNTVTQSEYCWPYDWNRTVNI